MEVDISKAVPQATIVNVQCCDYPNKALTGAGVSFKFIQCFEEKYIHSNDCMEYLDLAAIGVIGDMADYKEYEIRSIAVNGLKNLKNPFYKAMVAAHDYSIQKMNGLNYYSCAFYVVPFINALCRSGTMEEKEFCFKASLHEYAYQEVDNSKRGHKGEKVPWYEEAITVAERVKRRQTKLQDELMEICEKQIEDEHLNDNAIIFVRFSGKEENSNLNGLVANKIAAKYQKPAMVGELVGQNYMGSMRNYGLSERQDLKSDMEATGDIEWVAGQ